MRTLGFCIAIAAVAIVAVIGWRKIPKRIFAEHRDLSARAQESALNVLEGFRLPPQRRPPIVAIASYGNVAEEDLAFTERVLTTAFDVHTVRLASAPIPAVAVERKGQVDADALLEDLCRRRPPAADAVFGVIEADLYAAGRPYVFGYGHMRDRVAVYSSQRFREESYGRGRDDVRKYGRSLKAILHEFGHVCGIRHDDDPRCLMHEVVDLDHLDARAPRFCPRCLDRIRGWLADPPVPCEHPSP